MLHAGKGCCANEIHAHSPRGDVVDFQLYTAGFSFFSPMICGVLRSTCVCVFFLPLAHPRKVYHTHTHAIIIMTRVMMSCIYSIFSD